MKIYNNITELIGKTPLIMLNGIMKKHNLNAEIIVKAEFMNPAGSVKDRISLAMLVAAEKEGALKKGATIIEPTSGNTGIGIASAAAVLGYKTILIMPETMSEERRKLLSAYGAELILTDGKDGMIGAVKKAQELALTIKGSFIPSQFTNPANPKTHYETTGPEIYSDTDGHIDIFVCGIGTGGTITGVGRFLKQENPNIKIVAIEPCSSPLLSKGTAGPHGIQGIGANFVPQILDLKVIDEIICVTEQEAYTFGREAATVEGFLCGISSGAAISTALTLAKRKENFGKRIVALLPDSGERYLSTPLFNKQI